MSHALQQLAGNAVEGRALVSEVLPHHEALFDALMIIQIAVFQAALPPQEECYPSNPFQGIS